MPATRKPLSVLASVILAATVALAITIFASPSRSPETGASSADASRTSAEPHYVGRATCATCHREEDRRWRGSHHDLAMQKATPADR